MGMHYDVNMSRVKGGARQGPVCSLRGFGLDFGFLMSIFGGKIQPSALGPLRCARSAKLGHSRPLGHGQHFRFSDRFCKKREARKDKRRQAIEQQTTTAKQCAVSVRGV
jgi:hypothetical protein